MARKKGPQIEQAYHYVLNKIFNYELKPGDIISDNALAEELNMSRTPVREAIIMLTADGLVESRDYKTCVSSFGLQDIVDLCQARGAIERASVELILDRGGLTDAQKSELQSVFGEIEDALGSDDYERFNLSDEMFHNKLVEYSGNRQFVEITRRICIQVQRTKAINRFFFANRRPSFRDEHFAILENLVNNRREPCLEAIREHIQRSIESLRALLQDESMRSAISFFQSIYQHGI